MEQIADRLRSVVPCDKVQYFTSLALLSIRWERDDFCNTRAQEAQSHVDALATLLRQFGNTYPTVVTPINKCDVCKHLVMHTRHVGKLAVCDSCVERMVQNWRFVNA